nr:MAG TPA: hypothetical protein [Bacteriophage sp.]
MVTAPPSGWLLIAWFICSGLTSDNVAELHKELFL